MSAPASEPAERPVPWLLWLLAGVAIVAILVSVPLAAIHRRDQARSKAIGELLEREAEMELTAAKVVLDSKTPDESRHPALEHLDTADGVLRRLEETLGGADEPDGARERVRQLKLRAVALRGRLR